MSLHPCFAKRARELGKPQDDKRWAIAPPAPLTSESEVSYESLSSHARRLSSELARGAERRKLGPKSDERALGWETLGTPSAVPSLSATDRVPIAFFPTEGPDPPVSRTTTVGVEYSRTTLFEPENPGRNDDGEAGATLPSAPIDDESGSV